MLEEKQNWINKILFEYELDINFYTSYRGFPARLDLKSKNKKLWSIHDESNCRSHGVYNLFKKAYELSNKPDFETAIIVEDIPRDNINKSCFYFSTIDPNSYENVVPDYSFYSLALKGRCGYKGDINDDYESLTNAIFLAGQEPPQTNKVGWCGHAGVRSRHQLVELCNKPPLSDFCEVINIDWRSPDQSREWPDKFMTLDQQVKKWRYLIDVTGLGWTDRTKFFFFSNRVLFYIKRNNNEFYFKDLEPWVHYVPVDDLSDLKNKIKILINDENLENKIKKNALDFAQKNLTQKRVIEFYTNLINNTNWQEKSVFNFQKATDRNLPNNLKLNEI